MHIYIYINLFAYICGKKTKIEVKYATFKHSGRQKFLTPNTQIRRNAEVNHLNSYFKTTKNYKKRAKKEQKLQKTTKTTKKEQNKLKESRIKDTLKN